LALLNNDSVITIVCFCFIVLDSHLTTSRALGPRLHMFAACVIQSAFLHSNSLFLLEQLHGILTADMVRSPVHANVVSCTFDSKSRNCCTNTLTVTSGIASVILKESYATITYKISIHTMLYQHFHGNYIRLIMLLMNVIKII